MLSPCLPGFPSGPLGCKRNKHFGIEKMITFGVKIVTPDFCSLVSFNSMLRGAYFAGIMV